MMNQFVEAVLRTLEQVNDNMFRELMAEGTPFDYAESWDAGYGKSTMHSAVGGVRYIGIPIQREKTSRTNKHEQVTPCSGARAGLGEKT